MNTNFFRQQLLYKLILGLVIGLLFSNTLVAQSINFDHDWRFLLDDTQEVSSVVGADDSDWRLLDVPHDWSIELPYAEDNPGGKSGAFLPGGIGYYQKHFATQEEWEDKKVFIDFDGVYMNSTVWINGHELGTHPYGYTGFSYELTPYLSEQENVITVRVDHSKNPSGRWYTGSGIYRHVRLRITNPTFIEKDGVAIVSELLNDNTASLSITTLLVKAKEKINLTFKHVLTNANGTTLASQQEKTKCLQCIQKFEVTGIEKWSAESPVTYRLKTELYAKGKLIDETSSIIGFRTIEVIPDKGLFVNGKKTILKGMTNHHDAGPVGAAVPEDVLYRRLRILKEMGCNAIRTGHHPFAPEFYTMCDTMGFYVMDEAFDGWDQPKAKHDYGHYFAEWWQRDLESFIKRDRNHPSVIIWSIGNEVPKYTGERQKELADFLKTIDSTRYITQARGYREPYIDIAGFNGHGETLGYLEKYWNKHGDRALVGTEITHSYQTRGEYRTKTYYRARDFPAFWEPQDGSGFAKVEPTVYKVADLTEEEVFPETPYMYQSSYDNSFVRMNVRDFWKVTKDMPYFIGSFRWTGFDYLGESFGWPARTVSFGILDLAGFKTDQFYLYQSFWSDKSMVHLLPHWTHPGKEGIEIPVVAYTNGTSAELFLNGKSLGEKPVTDDLQIVWMVPYEPGILDVVGKEEGKEIARKSVTTAGEAYSLRVTADKSSMQAGSDEAVHLEVEIVDKAGNFVPKANHLISFEIEGPGKLIGVENGDVLDMGLQKVNYRKAFNGMCLAIIQPTRETGVLKINVKGEGLKTSVVEIEVK